MVFENREKQFLVGKQKYGSKPVPELENFDEDKIKRDDTGKFSSKSGSKSGSLKKEVSKPKKETKDLSALKEKKHEAFAAFKDKEKEWQDKTGRPDGFYIEDPIGYRDLRSKMDDASKEWSDEYEKQNPMPKKKKSPYRR